MYFLKRLLAGCLCLLLMCPTALSVLPALAEEAGATAVSRYKVLHDELVGDQTLTYEASGTRYQYRTNITFNESVQAKFDVGETHELALYLNLFIENTADPDNLEVLTALSGNDRRIVIQHYEPSDNTYYEAYWYFPDMDLHAGWNQVLLAFASSATDASDAVPARKQTMRGDWQQILEIKFGALSASQATYNIQIANVMVVDTAFDTEGNSLRVEDPEAPDYKKLQNVIHNQSFNYNASSNRFVVNGKITFNNEVKTAAVEDLALYMDVYIDNPADPDYINLFADAGGQLAIQYHDSVENKYHEVRWLTKNQLGSIDWKKGWNRVLLCFSPQHRDPNGVAPWELKDLWWDVEQNFQFGVDNLPTDKDYTKFKIRLANVSIVDTSRSESNPDIGTMKTPDHRAVNQINERIAHLTTTTDVYSWAKTDLDLDTSSMNKEDLAVFANVYLPDASAGDTVTLALTNSDDQELTWITTLQTGWNAMQLPLADAAPADASAEGFNSFRVTVDSTLQQDVRLGTVYLINTKAPYSEQELTMSNVFGDHMLFQRNKPIYVWGYAAAGDTVTVTLTETESGKVVGENAVTAASDNTFTATLPALEGGYTAYTLSIEDKDAVSVKSTKTFTDIVIGELWVASGQSNMELTVKNDHNSSTILAEAKAAPNTNVRYLKERSWPYNSSVEHPLTPNFDIVDTYWDTAANTNLLQNVSSIGYQFALQLQQELDIPVGIVSNAAGGCRIECWISREGIDSDNEIKTFLQNRNKYFDESNWPLDNNRMSTLYNEVIGPLAGWEEGKGLQITGAIWYQGESTLDSNGMYDKFLELLQKDWSRTFGFGDQEMPLIYALIAPHLYGNQISDLSADMTRAWNRHTDSMAQVTLYDCPLIYENGDGSINAVIHPTVKTPVAERYALAAMDLLYGGTLDATAPVYKNMSITDNGRIRVTFDKVGSGLSVIDNGTDLHGFSIAGADGVFVNAKAVIVSADTVEVWNDRVTEPANVAYAYGNFVTTANLKNSAGFPASPFCTATTGTFFHPQEWLYADGEVWVHYNDGKENADYLDLWQVAAGDATTMYDTDYKAEGKASLKVTYTGTSAAVTPTWSGTVNGHSVTYPGLKKPSDRIQYLTAYVANPDDRSKTMRLEILSNGSIYKTNEVTVAAGSDFLPYSFALNSLTAANGSAVSNTAAVLQNLTEIRFTVVDTIDGTVYLDDLQFGMDDAPNALVDTTALRVLVEENLNAAHYTADSWAPYAKALEQATTLLQDETATHKQVRDMIMVLTNARELLERADTPSDTIQGDVDGDTVVTANDALMALQAATNKVTLTADQTTVADVDGTAGISPNDALMILQYATKKISSF